MCQASWDQFKFSELTIEILLTHVWGSPGSGFDKTHSINIKNVYVRDENPYVVDDPTNTFSFYKLLKHYRSKCHPDQGSLFCRLHKTLTKETTQYRVNPKNHYSVNFIARFAKEVAEVCDFKDWEVFAAHGFRRELISTSISNNAPTLL